MTFEEWQSIVEKTVAADWQMVTENRYVFKGDVSVSLSWESKRGIGSEYSSPKLEEFFISVGPRATVRLSYIGEVMAEWPFLWVDTQRRLIPCPTEFGIKRDRLAIGNLIFGIIPAPDAMHHSLQQILTGVPIDIID